MPSTPIPALFDILDAGPDDGGTTEFRAVVRPGLHGRGPWDHTLLHGGPVGGLAGWAAEQLARRLDHDRPDDPPLICSRLTVELLSGVPLEPVSVGAMLVKPGRRARLIDVVGRVGDRIVLRASSQWVVTSSDVHPEPPNDRPAGGPLAPPPAPMSAAPADPGGSGFGYPRPGFNCDAVQLRLVAGSTEDPGPGLAWARLAVPLIAGQANTPFTIMATLADLAAAVGWEPGPGGESSINPDITLQLARYPRGPWVAFDAANHRVAGGVGFNEAIVHDEQGPIGRVLQTLVTSPLTLPLPPLPGSA